RYIDKNYAAVFIIWDRIFGTFVEETETPYYGTVRPFESWNSIWANFDYPVKLIRDSAQARGFWHKLAYFFAPPERTADGGIEVVPEVDAATYRKFAAANSARSVVYVALNLVLVIVGLFLVLLNEHSISLTFEAGAVVLVLLTTAIMGGVM